MSALDLLLVLLLMWGVVVAIYLVLFFPNILDATKHRAGGTPTFEGKRRTSETKPEHPTFPRAA